MNVLMAAQITGRISTLSLASMTVSAFLLVAFPVFCIFYFRHRLDADIKEILFGAIAYILIALLLVNLLTLLLSMIPGAADFFAAHRALLVLVNMLITVLPEIGALALFFSVRKDKKQNLPAYMEFAAGYVTVELVMVAGTVTMTNLMIAGTYNEGGIAALMELTGMEAGADFSYIQEMIDMPFYAYLLSGIEGCLFASIRIGFMILMYMINRKGLPKYYYAVIIGMYFLVKLPSALADLNVIGSGLIDPLLVLICAAEVAYLFRMAKQGIPEEFAPLLKKPEISFRRKKKAAPRSKDQGFH